ncbi:hypothetical protein LTR67_010156 [Exophiala xenobiotica]
MSSRNSSTSSQSSNASTSQPSPRHVSSVCYPKGKCMANFANMAGKENQTDAGDNWTRDIYGKMR